jgi:hypothetical protein
VTGMGGCRLRARADGADVPGKAGAARRPRVMIQVLTPQTVTRGLP